MGYSQDETDLIACITRTRDCQVGDCCECGWKHNKEYETIDGKWWLFIDGGKYRELTDEEARKVIWG